MKHGDEMRLADKKLELDRNKHEDEQQNHQDNVLTIVAMVVSQATEYLPEVVIKGNECVTGVVGKAKECFNANTFSDKGKKVAEDMTDTDKIDGCDN